MRRYPTLAIVLMALFMAGCSSRIHYPRADGDPAAPAHQTAVQFTYQKHQVAVSRPDHWQTEKFRASTFSMKSIGNNGQPGNYLSALYFQSKQAGPKPLVIILPIWGVNSFPSSALSRHIRRAGGGAVNVLELLGESRLFNMEKTALAPTPDSFLSLMDEMAHRIANMVIDIRRIVDWAETQPDIDRDRIGIVGFSLGAMVASVAVSNEPRLDAGILVMGSASPHDSFTTCGGAAGQMREMVSNRFKWTRDQYRNAIKGPLAKVDPARFPGRVDPRNILIIEAGEDTCLPATARQQLWEVMGRPERIVYAYDHRATFYAMSFLGGGSLQKEAFKFLKKVFGMTPGG